MNNLLAAALLALAVPAVAAESSIGTDDDPSLFATILARDTAAFDDFNHCADPARLQRHAAHFAEDVEFYHDTGGVTWDRDTMLANTARYACGNYRRERVEGTFRVHPVKDFGAIAQGTHRFCQTATGSCDGLAEFTMIWRQQDGQWRITRVLSYGHRPAGGDDASR